VVQTIVPSYRIYMQNYGPLVEREGNADKYVKFTVDGLEKMVSTLFMPRPRRGWGLPNQALDWEDYQCEMAGLHLSELQFKKQKGGLNIMQELDL
jgi:hypothetical protein